MLSRFAILIICVFYTAIPAAVDCSLKRATSTSLDRVAQVKAAIRDYVAAESNPVYSNDWAVQVHGGESAANQIAEAHGFLNMGKVRSHSDQHN